MDRDYGCELDELRTEIAELQEVLRSLTEALAEERGKPHAHGPHEQEGPHGREAPGGPGRLPEDGPHGGRRDYPGWDTPPRPGPHVPGAERGPRGRFLDSREERWAGKVRKMPHMHPDHNVMALLDDLENEVGRQSVTGAITYLGVYTSGGQQSTWIRRGVSTDGLLQLIEDRSAERVLACIGSNDRLNLLLALLRRPMTVAQLVEECGYNSTGQVYHHLRPLIAANLVAEDEHGAVKGRYLVVSHRVQGIIMLLAGISDMLDPSYTQGEWQEDDREPFSDEAGSPAEEGDAPEA